MQQGADDKIAEQVEQVKSNYQTAKDVDLMQSYYQQQQKLFDIYLQTTTDDTSTSADQNTSAVSALTNTYADLYALHQNVKQGVGQLPVISAEHEAMGIEKSIATLPASSVANTNELAKNASNQPLSHKQLDAYNSLMMPSTSSYVHFSA